MPDATALFAAHAATYDAARGKLIPPFDRFYGAAIEALELAGEPMGRVLDLGAGTGMLSGMVAAAHPSAQLVLVDGAPAMLDRARERLRGHPRAAYVVADLRDALPPGPFDAVVSALAIHHLPDEDKRALLGRPERPRARAARLARGGRLRHGGPRVQGRALRRARGRALTRSARQFVQALR